jgi:hypothetical protein
MSKYPDYKYINVKVIAKSLNLLGDPITTFELDYPRYIHSEIMTHRVFGRNAQSSRAVPVNKTLEVNTDFVKPIIWGKNKAGMSSKEELQDETLNKVRELWDRHARTTFEVSKELTDLGLHKQWSNRITEPFSRIKVVITATEWDNFFWLRDDEDAAQPEIVELAQRMKDAYEDFAATQLDTGHWHLPYVFQEFDSKGNQYFLDETASVIPLEDAVKISVSCCAQVSYRRLDQSKEKAIDIYNKLFSGPKPHLSPCEHPAKVGPKYMDFKTPGITHMDKAGNAWSGNLKNFVQYRQLWQQGIPVK